MKVKKLPIAKWTLNLASVCLLCLTCVGLTSCDTNQYNAILYDKAENILTEDFLTENATHYPSINDDGLPNNRCVIIDTQEEFDAAFNSLPDEINFEQDVIIIYVFTDTNYGFECELKKITKKDGNLQIEIFHHMTLAPCGSSPTQRCLAIKLSNCQFDSVDIKIDYPNYWWA